MSKILIISHPNFINGIKEIVSQVQNHSIDFLSSKADSYQNKTRIKKAKVFKEYDIVHFFWANTNLFDLLYYKLISRVKIINHFIGSDLNTILNRKLFRKRLELRICSYISKFVVTGNNMKTELDNLGIKNLRVDFLNSDIKKRDYTYPEKKVSAVYLPSTRKSFYRFNFCYRLAEDFPDVEFLWFPYEREESEKLPNNVETIEYIEHSEIFSFLNRARVFIRIPEHDGLPNTLIESLSIGRWAIWSFEHYGALTAVDYEELRNNFTQLINKIEANYDGESFAIKNYNFDKISQNFLKLYN